MLQMLEDLGGAEGALFSFFCRARVLVLALVLTPRELDWETSITATSPAPLAFFMYLPILEPREVATVGTTIIVPNEIYMYMSVYPPVYILYLHPL
jgi:hypothetical protein